MEVAECSALYNARTAQLQAMENQIDNLDWKLKQQSKASEEALQASEQGILALQRRLESTKMAAEEEASKYNDLLRTLEFTKGAAEAVERRLEEAQREKKDLSEQNEWLEQQVKIAMGGEKQYLLSELAKLHRENQTLQGEVTEWQEKFQTLSHHVIGLESIFSTEKSPTSILDPKLINDQLSGTFETDSHSESQHSEQDQWMMHIKPTSTQRKSPKESNSMLDGNANDGKFVTRTLMKNNYGTQYRINQRSSTGENHEVLFGGKWGMNGQGGQVPVTTLDGGRSVNSFEPNKMSNMTGCGSCQKSSCVVLRENLLAAAHREIIKLKEINQCLVSACKSEPNSSK